MYKSDIRLVREMNALKKLCEKCGCREVCDEDCMIGIANPYVECSEKCSEEVVRNCEWYYFMHDLYYGPTNEEEPD